MQRVFRLDRLFFFLMGTLVLLQAVRPLNAVAPRENPLVSIGVATEVLGKVRVKNFEGDERVIKAKDALFVSDEIKTGRRGLVKMKMQDETVFTLGPKTKMILEKFQFDAAKKEAALETTLEGTFRFLSGKIPKHDPENFKVKLPTAIVGVRGTQVAGQGSRSEALVVLEKPENPGAHQNHAVVTDRVDGESVDLTTFGFGTTIKRGGAPSAPFQVPERKLQKLQNALQPPEGDVVTDTLFGSYDMIKGGVKDGFDMLNPFDGDDDGAPEHEPGQQHQGH